MAVTFTPDTTCDIGVNGQYQHFEAGTEATVEDHFYASYVQLYGTPEDSTPGEDAGEVQQFEHPDEQFTAVTNDDGTTTLTSTDDDAEKVVTAEDYKDNYESVEGE